MSFAIGDSESLLSAIDFCDNDIVFLVGSPLSCSYADIKGIPGVKDMLELIEVKVSERQRTHDSYHKSVGHIQADTEKYQASFDFLRLYTSPNTVNGIIRRATLQAISEDTQEMDINNIEALENLQENVELWSIPPATQGLAEVLSFSDKVSNIVLTPNFDPLISIALTKLGHSPTRTILHGDSNLEQFQSSTNMNIVHFHGYWLEADTLHTSDQLTIDRPLLKQSLTRLLNSKTLVVLGYGGWDDVFTQALFSIIKDNGANFDILWSFYESNEDVINSKYENLIESVKPALQRGRFKVFGGINCHEFLPELAKESKPNKTENEPKEQVTIPSVATNDVPSLKVHSFEDETVDLVSWAQYYDPAHNAIRTTERSYLVRSLGENKYVNLTAEWGIGHKEFVCTLNSTDEYAESPIYRLDLSDVRSKNALLEKVETELGLPLQVFIQKLPRSRHIVFFDNVEGSLNNFAESSAFISELENIISIITDFNDSSRVIVASRKVLKGRFTHLELSRLELFDAKAFIANHTSAPNDLGSQDIDTIIDIAKGVPTTIESCLRDTEYFTSEELYEEYFMPESYNFSSNDSLPEEIVKRVELLADSQEQLQKRAYSLLETLAVLEFGDTFTNLRKSNSDFSYNKQHLEILIDLELVETEKVTKTLLVEPLNTGEIKILKLPAAVRTYVYSKLTVGTVYEISKNMANVHLGNDWRNGRINFCKLTKDQFSENDKIAGSTHMLLAQLLKCAIELDIGRDIDAVFRACREYALKVSNVGKYKEVVSFSKQVRAIAKESDKIESLAFFYLIEGRASRMLSEHNHAEKLLKSSLDEGEHLTKKEKIRAMTNLMFIYERSEGSSDKAIEYAKKIIELDSSDADAKLTLEFQSDTSDINKLKAMEEKFRNKKRYSAANNAAISLSDLETGTLAKVRWLDRVISCPSKNQYNKLRAVTRKAKITSKDGEYKPSSIELNLLHSCYLFSFSQGMNSLFNDAHRVLWKYYAAIKHYNTLFNLYRHSSLYWRIYDDISKEIAYSALVTKLLGKLLPSSIDLTEYENAYAVHRANLLTESD
ncbi:SIR2 family protein [Photobacterium profundum]